MDKEINEAISLAILTLKTWRKKNPKKRPFMRMQIYEHVDNREELMKKISERQNEYFDKILKRKKAEWKLFEKNQSKFRVIEKVKREKRKNTISKDKILLETRSYHDEIITTDKIISKEIIPFIDENIYCSLEVHEGENICEIDEPEEKYIIGSGMIKVNMKRKQGNIFGAIIKEHLDEVEKLEKEEKDILEDGMKNVALLSEFNASQLSVEIGKCSEINGSRIIERSINTFKEDSAEVWEQFIKRLIQQGGTITVTEDKYGRIVDVIK